MQEMKNTNQNHISGPNVPRTSPDRGTARLMDLPDGFTDGIAPCFDFDVYYVTAGPSESQHLPVLLIHGALVSRRYFLPTAELLCQKYKVYAPDLIGHGGSTKPEGTLSVTSQAAVLAEFLRSQGIGKAYVVANSYGCEVAVELAAYHPELVERLVLIGPTCDRSRPNLALQFMRLCADGLYEHPTMFLVLMKDLCEMSLRRAIETSQIMINYRTLDVVPKINCKTLIVRGSKDAIAPEEWTHKVVRAFRPQVKYIPVIGAPHNVQFSAAPILSRVIDDFLNDRPIGRVPRVRELQRQAIA